MTSDHIFWFFAGVMTALAAVALAFPLFNSLRAKSGLGRARLVVFGSTAILIGASLAMYRLWGTPGAISMSAKESALVSAMGETGEESLSSNAPNSAGKSKVGSVEEATEKLAKRLNSAGGTPADWSLLAQSYDFLGRSANAAEARKHAGEPDSTASPGSSAPAATIHRVSDEGTALLTKAEKSRIAHDYKTALDLYAEAVRLDALDADAWANYADAAASLTGGKLDGAPANYLAEALKRDPDHPKALWLQASLLHEQKRYAQAVEVWRHLARVLPAASSDAKIIAANIAEALRLAGSSPAPSVIATSDGIQITGTIDIDPTLRAKAGVGQALFVFAKSVDSPGPPLAVVRTTVGQWPVKFSLNDSQAMLPKRKLSDFHAVTVEARISVTGQPLAQPGDLHGVTGTLDPKSDKPVHVVIREVIG